MSRLGLADARYVVMLAFDREQANPLDGREIDGPAAMSHLTERQRMTYKDGIDSLQIILSGEIHNGEIFVVEFLVFVRRVAVAAHQVHEQLLVRFDMAVEIH